MLHEGGSVGRLKSSGDPSSLASLHRPMTDFVCLLVLCPVAYGGGNLGIHVPAHYSCNTWAVGPHTLLVPLYLLLSCATVGAFLVLSLECVSRYIPGTDTLFTRILHELPSTLHSGSAPRIIRSGTSSGKLVSLIRLTPIPVQSI